MKKKILIRQLLFFLTFGLTSCNQGAAITSEPEMVTNLLTEAVTPKKQPSSMPSSQPSLQAFPYEPNQEIQLDELDIAYTAAPPLSDPEEILAILDALAQRHVEWFSRPGWVVHQVYITEDGPYKDEQYIWGTHFVNNLGDCTEQFFFTARDGEVHPSRIVLADGTEAQLYSVNGELGHASVIPPEEGFSCQMEDAGHVFEIVHTGSGIEMRFESVRTGALVAYEVLLWKEVIHNRDVIVLYENAEILPFKGFSSLEDGTFVSIDREISWTYHDPQTGGVIGKDGVTYGENGEILDGAEKGVREVVFSDLAFYDELPPELAHAYEESAQALRNDIK